VSIAIQVSTVRCASLVYENCVQPARFVRNHRAFGGLSMHVRSTNWTASNTNRLLAQRSAPVTAGTRLLAAAGSRLVAAGVCAEWGGGVAGLVPPPAAVRPALLGVLLRCAAAKTAPATAPPSPCATATHRQHAHIMERAECAGHPGITTASRAVAFVQTISVHLLSALICVAAQHVQDC
jgi:hypothetical protein